jgi:poly-gamma-glutamate synthesis protein (capsule biosynthesis protein)
LKGYINSKFLSKVNLLIIIIWFNAFIDAEASNLKRQGNHTVIAVGDIMLTGSARPVLKKKGYSHSFQDAHVSVLIKKGDVAVANLEYPVTLEGEAFKNKQYVYRGEPESMRAIKMAGFDMLSIANNHIMDYGEKGLLSTIDNCRKNSLICCGAGADLEQSRKPGVLKKNGITYALLSYSMTYPNQYWATSKTAGVTYGEKSAVEEDIRQIREKADVVMVSFHWGAELMESPREYQIRMAHFAIDSGADMVLGHHPHIPQGIEIYNGKPIFYSLGNFAFGSNSKNTVISFAAEIIMKGRDVSKVIIHPLVVDNYIVGFRPEYATGKKARDIINHLAKISEPFKTGIFFRNGAGELSLCGIR